MPPKRLTQEEIDFVKTHFPENGSKFCCEKLNISDRRLRAILEKFKIKINPQTYKKLIVNAYIRNNRDKLELEYRKLFNFEIDEICYFFGFFWADGSIKSGGKLISIGIQEGDGENVKSAFLKAFDFKVEIKPRNRYGIKTKNIMLFRKNSLFCFQRLVELEFDKKTLTSPFKVLSVIPKDKHYLFWRGFFDGDGCSLNKGESKRNFVSFAGSYNQNWYCLLRFLKKLKINPKIHKSPRGGSTVYFCKVNEIQEFFKVIYPNGWDGIGLKRKFDSLLSVRLMPRHVPQRKFPISKLGFRFVYKKGNGFCFSIKIDGLRYSKSSRDVKECVEYGNKILEQNGMPLNTL